MRGVPVPHPVLRRGTARRNGSAHCSRGSFRGQRRATRPPPGSNARPAGRLELGRCLPPGHRAMWRSETPPDLGLPAARAHAGPQPVDGAPGRRHVRRSARSAGRPSAVAAGMMPRSPTPLRRPTVARCAGSARSVAGFAAARAGHGRNLARRGPGRGLGRSDGRGGRGCRRRRGRTGSGRAGNQRRSEQRACGRDRQGVGGASHASHTMPDR